MICSYIEIHSSSTSYVVVVVVQFKVVLLLTHQVHSKCTAEPMANHEAHWSAVGSGAEPMFMSPPITKWACPMVHPGLACELLCSRFVSSFRRWESFNVLPPDGAWTFTKSTLLSSVVCILLDFQSTLINTTLADIAVLCTSSACCLPSVAAIAAAKG